MPSMNRVKLYEYKVWEYAYELKTKNGKRESLNMFVSLQQIKMRGLFQLES